MFMVSPNTTKTFSYSFIGECASKTQRGFLVSLHQTAAFTNCQKFSFTLHELPDVDKCKVVIIPYFREKPEKFTKNAVFC